VAHLDGNCIRSGGGLEFGKTATEEGQNPQI
jgi:hypothetical protein